MEISTRRRFFGKIAAMAALVTGAAKLFSQQTSPAAPPPPTGAPMTAAGDDRAHRAASHTHDGIYYFSGTGSNDGYQKEDHILVTDPFEKHVTRTMDALKKSVERAGCTMDSIIHAQVFFCLPLADGVSMPT
jgi:enamine deaminase RidA (YjgF/YER057c/UK114 family)